MSSCSICGCTSGWDCWCSFIASCTNCGCDLTADQIADNDVDGALCEGCARTRVRAREIAGSLSPLARVNVTIMAQWHRGESNPPCLVSDEVVPLCLRAPDGIGWVCGPMLLSVAAVIEREAVKA